MASHVDVFVDHITETRPLVSGLLMFSDYNQESPTMTVANKSIGDVADAIATPSLFHHCLGKGNCYWKTKDNSIFWDEFKIYREVVILKGRILLKFETVEACDSIWAILESLQAPMGLTLKTCAHQYDVELVSYEWLYLQTLLKEIKTALRSWVIVSRDSWNLHLSSLENLIKEEIEVSRRWGYYDVFGPKYESWIEDIAELRESVEVTDTDKALICDGLLPHIEESVFILSKVLRKRNERRGVKNLRKNKKFELYDKQEKAAKRSGNRVQQEKVKDRAKFVESY